MIASAVLPSLRAASTSTLRRGALASAAAAPRAFPAPSLRTFASTRSVLELKTRYTPEHEWVTLDTDTNVGTVGITDYAQKSLGDVVYVELPAEGSDVKSGEQIGAVESVKAASDIYSPITGSVTAVNERLADEANLLNKSPEQDGQCSRPDERRHS